MQKLIYDIKSYWLLSSFLGEKPDRERRAIKNIAILNDSFNEL